MFKEINDYYYSLFSDLYACRPVLPDKQYKRMSDALMDQYERELDVLVGTKQLERARDSFELHYRLKNYIPRRCLFGLNKIGRAIKRQLVADFKAYLKSMKLDKAPPDDEEPQAPQEPPVTALQPAGSTELQQR